MDSSHYRILLNQLKKSSEPGKSSVMFVNPHFRQGTTPHLPNRVLVNPNFAGSNINNANTLNKIHFNPRFVNPQTPIDNPQKGLTAMYSNFTPNKSDSQIAYSVPTAHSVPSTSSKTRYKFIRHATNSPQKVSETVQQSQVKALVKISKYKITKSNKSTGPVVRRSFLSGNTTTLNGCILNRKLNNRKVDNRKLDNRKFESKKVDNKKVGLNKKVYKHLSVNKIVNINGKKFSVIGNCLKLISPNPATKRVPKNHKISVNGKIYVSNGNKSLIKKGTKTVDKLKKNNIPCPVFRKQGKCIRKMKGICQYVHDRKHVILCKKFLKGACCDLQCLLSHELSKKKMPTCSFYLQGSCTRENCPYLHVKLNDKADICEDFLKGYCEKGEDCNKRHTYILCPDLSKNGKCVKRLCPYPHKRIICYESRGKIENKHGNTAGKSATCILNQEIDSSNKRDDTVQSGTTEGSRYFVQEHNSEELKEVVEYVKHKLGMLPSFIKL